MTRITVACTLILSQFTYIATILYTNDDTLCSRIQTLLNNFVMNPKREEQDKGRNWLSNDLLFTPKQKGGLGFKNFRDFVKALKMLWVKRYTEGCNNHWCDLIDLNLGLNPTNKHLLTEWGNLDFKPIE